LPAACEEQGGEYRIAVLRPMQQSASLTGDLASACLIDAIFLSGGVPDTGEVLLIDDQGTELQLFAQDGLVLDARSESSIVLPVRTDATVTMVSSCSSDCLDDAIVVRLYVVSSLVQPPPPVWISLATHDIPIGSTLNVDEGSPGDSGQDLSHDLGPDSFGLVTPISGASMAFVGSGFAGYSDCLTAEVGLAFTMDPVPATSLSPGDHLCVRSPEGRIADVVVRDLHPELGLRLLLTTWLSP